MFNVYIEIFGVVHEPAEGGYYVEISTMDIWDTFSNAIDARKAVDEAVNEYEDVVFYEDNVQYDYGLDDYDDDGDMITAKADAEFICEINRSVNYYLGNGFRFICVAEDFPEPYPETYTGYR